MVRLRTRLLFVVLLSMIGAFVLTAFAVIPASKRMLVERVERRLLDDAAELERLIDADGIDAARDSSGVAGLRSGFNDYVVLLIDPASGALETLVESGSPERRDPIPVFDQALVEPGETEWVTGSGDFAYIYTVIDPGIQQSVIVGAPVDDLGSMANELSQLFLRFGLSATAIVAVLSWWWVRRTTRPIEHLAQRASRIASGDPDRTLIAPATTSELKQLTVALDTMVQSLDQATQVQTAVADRMRVFVADASHELRTPLTSVHGYLQMDVDGVLDDSQRHHTAMLRALSEAERMKRLIEDLHVLSEADEQQNSPMTTVDLCQVASDCVLDSANLDDSREWEFEADVAPVLVSGNDDQLRQILANLMSNARQHTPIGTRVVTSLRTTPTAVELTVDDDGPGLRSDQFARVFDRFWRADPSRSRATGGGGLGLSIVSSLTERHGGSTTARPSPLGGLSVVVTLPRRETIDTARLPVRERTGAGRPR
jgi:two-component system, OmpR family, sensor kinase